ncbi:hypothetical protein C0J52_23236, partial [Blattella germanica]
LYTLWSTYHRRELVVETCKQQLADLGLDYIDLYLIHSPNSFKEGDDFWPKDADGKLQLTDVDYVDTWKGMEECVKLGLTKSIGISNFNSQQINRILESATIKPVVNQVEVHPYLNQSKLIAFCKEKGIVVTAYCPLGSPNAVAKAEMLPPLKDTKLQELAQKYKKSVAQVILRYLLWCTFHKREMVVDACKQTLKDHGLDYLDLYLIHWPNSFKEGGDLWPKDSNGKVLVTDEDYVDTWKGMEECVKLGLTKSIGISNFNSHQINRVLAAATIKPVVNQIEVHPYFNQSKLIAFCKEKGIVVTAYSPLGSPNAIAKEDTPAPLQDPKLQELAKKYKKSVAQIILRYLASKGGEVKQVVKDAIDVGYRHIDGAMVYENEKEVGAAINAKIAEGVIKREDIFVTSKLWNTYHKPDLVLKGIKKTLSDFGLQYLDLYLIHWPFAFKEGDELWPKDEDGKVITSDVDYVETWKQMEECVKLGLTKSIGVSNFNSKQLQRVLDTATIKPVTNQVECHPYLNQSKLLAFCKKHNIVITAYSPLGSPNSIAGETTPAPLKDPKVLDISKRHGKTPAQIIIRYLIQHGTVPIPKSSNKKRLQENFDVFNFELSPEEMAEIDALDRNGRICKLNFDSAMIYKNEHEIGAAVNAKIKEGKIKREDVFITNKEGMNPWPVDDNGKIIPSNTDYTECWKGMEECVRQGLVKSIGLSNFNSEQIKRILDIATIKPTINQVECYPYLNQNKLRKFCKERGIFLMAYAPLGRPGNTTFYMKSGIPPVLEDPKLKEIAAKYNKTVAQIIIRYLLSPEDVSSIDDLNQNNRAFTYPEYGNEKEIGAGLKAKIDEGVIKREDIFVTSKLWNTHHRPDLVIQACQTSLSDLGLNYLDLYLMHFPFAIKEGDELKPMDETGRFCPSDVDYVDTWKVMEECVKRGLVRSIGLSNFNSQQVDRILSIATIKPAVHQFECHIYLNQRKLIDFCKARGMVVTGYCPLGSPGSSAKPDTPPLLLDPRLVPLSTKYNKTAVQIVLRYLIQHGIIPLPKSVNKQHQKENFDIFNFELNSEDMAYLDTFDEKIRIQGTLNAIDVGYRHFDCAMFYENEAEVGAGIRAKISEGVIKREDVFITSKLWNTYHRPGIVVPTCKRTLKALGLDYLDLYLIHWPHAFKEGDDFLPADSSGKLIYSDEDYVDTWKAMEDCLKQGLTKSIGLSNFNSKQIQRVLDIATIKPVVECHPYLNQKKLIEFCKKKGIVVTAYSPFGGPDSIALGNPNAPAPLKDPKINEIAKKRGKSPAQIILRYLIQVGVVPLPKTIKKNRLQENFEALNFELTPQEVAAIDTLNTNTRICHKNELVSQFQVLQRINKTI